MPNLETSFNHPEDSFALLPPSPKSILGAKYRGPSELLWVSHTLDSCKRAVLKIRAGQLTWSVVAAVIALNLAKTLMVQKLHVELLWGTNCSCPLVSGPMVLFILVLSSWIQTRVKGH
jgi:hypothetical protein